MKKIFLCCVVFLAAISVNAGTFDGFQEFADAGSLKPFARDLGSLLGSDTAHNARPLGFSGFDAGVHAALQFYPDKNDRILRNNGVKAFSLPLIQAEIGMPYRFDGFVRGMAYEGMVIAGGGVRYGLLKGSDEAWSPQLIVVGMAHSVVHQYFAATHAGGDIIYSMGTARFNPYVGVGMDHIRLYVASASDKSLNGTSVSTLESRFTAGMRLRLWTFGYVHAAYVLAHGQSGAEAGLGVRF
jgi:hypothetical protein